MEVAEKRRDVFVTLSAAFLLTLFAIGIVYVLSTREVSILNTQSSRMPPPAPPSIAVPGSDWTTFSSDKNLYTFTYPPMFEASEEANTILQYHDKPVMTIEILSDNKGKFDYCIYHPQNSQCEWITDRGLQTVIDKGNKTSLTALVTLNSGRYAFIRNHNAAVMDLDTFRTVLLSFKTLVSPELKLWDPVCTSLNIETFSITVSHGDGITHIARKALNEYLNEVTLHNIPNRISTLTSEEKIFAEDYIAKSLKIARLTAGKTLSIPCQFVENAVVEVRTLTVQEKQNLEKYGNTVDQYEVSEMLHDAVDDSFKNSKIKPQILELQ
ncbi:MAG: hypothetical protein WBB36_11665 [Chitinophagales bacterium]|jgi:hypothetical protein